MDVVADAAGEYDDDDGDSDGDDKDDVDDDCDGDVIDVVDDDAAGADVVGDEGHEIDMDVVIAAGDDDYDDQCRC